MPIFTVWKWKQKDLEGKSILAIARAKGREPADVALDMMMEEEGRVIVVIHAMSEDDVRYVLRHPLVMIGTDGIAMPGKPHPRAYGSYLRILRKYVREERVLSLEEAIRKMSALPAEKLGLKGRGLIAEGYMADLVAFNPSKIHERSTYVDPHQEPQGIEYVLVNGAMALEKGQLCGLRRGRILAR